MLKRYSAPDPRPNLQQPQLHPIHQPDNHTYYSSPSSHPTSMPPPRALSGALKPLATSPSLRLFYCPITHTAPSHSFRPTSRALSSAHPASSTDTEHPAPHSEHYDPPSGWLFNVPPGEKYKKEGWENLWVWGFWGSLGLAVVGYAYKPDTS